MVRSGGEFGLHPIGDPQIRSEEGIWKGDDLVAGSDIVVYDTAIVPVFVGPGVLPNNPEFSFTSLAQLKSATRSRLAQLGLEVDEKAGRQIATIAQKRGVDIAPGATFPSELVIHNHSAAPIKIDKGTKLSKFYKTPDNPIRGEDLVDMVLNRHILIEGSRRRDWNWVHGKGFIKSNDEITGIAVRIKSGNRFWIPPRETPISTREIDEAGEEYRKVLDSYFVPVPIMARTVLWIGETVEMSLDSSVDAELDKPVAPNLSATGSLDRWGEQIDARSIDRNKKWPIRVEVLSPTTNDRIPNYVTFKYYAAEDLAHAA